MATKFPRYCVQIPGSWSDAIKNLAHRNQLTITQAIQQALKEAMKSAGIPVPKQPK